MVIDAMRRGGCCNNQWYWIIIFVPFGEWIYFFMVKIHDPEFVRISAKLFKRAPSLQALRAHYAHTPSSKNKEILAWALHAANEQAEAESLFAELLAADSKDKLARFGLALAQSAKGDHVLAAKNLEQVVAANLNYKDFEAATALANEYWQTDQKQKAIDLMAQISKLSKRLAHRVSWAEYLYETGQADQAKSMLQNGLIEYRNSPKFVRKIERSAAKVAERDLKSWSQKG
jgi:hypothetical protein